MRRISASLGEAKAWLDNMSFEEQVLEEFYNDIVTKLNQQSGLNFKVSFNEIEQLSMITCTIREEEIIIYFMEHDISEDRQITYYNCFNVFHTCSDEPDEYISASQPNLERLIIDVTMECVHYITDYFEEVPQ